VLLHLELGEVCGRRPPRLKLLPVGVLLALAQLHHEAQLH
jgi:hypothetical protein